MKSNNKRQLLKRTLGIFWWVFLILLALVLVKVIGAKMSGKVPTVLNYSVVYIVSGSMEDEIPRGSYILIKDIDADEVKCGDVICFYSTDPAIYGMPNTHRVVEEPIVTDSGIEFVTRGDANPVNDVVNAQGDRLIGVYVKRLSVLDAFSGLVSGKGVIFVIFGLQIALFSMIAYNVVASRHKNRDDGENAQNTDSRDTGDPEI